MARMRQIAATLEDADREWRAGSHLQQLHRNDGGAARMKAERDRQILSLRFASPARAAASQADAAHLPLFVAANEPTLF